MKHTFCSLFLLFLLLPRLTFADSANISGLFFVNQEQIILPNELSNEIKVQTQNISGTSESVSETNDVMFSSTSPTGEFLNSSGNVVTKTMSKNTSSRTFYYRDSALGTFDITVTITGRETGVTFTATQSVTVSNDVEDSDTGSNESATTTITSSSNNQTLSAHSSTQTITYIVQKITPKVDAGRARLATTKSPIEFEANTEGFENDTRIHYEWTFGDGKSETGKIVRHSYNFPGIYVVILNATGSVHRAVSRTEVTVVKPDVHIVGIQSGIDANVELINNSDYEINIQDWRLKNDKNEFIFPHDTIIKPKTSIKFQFDNSGQVALLYPDGSEVDHVTEKPEQVSYNWPTKEEIEIAKAKVTAQFAREEQQNFENHSLNSETLNTEILGTQGKSDLSDSVLKSSNRTSSIIDSLNANKSEDQSGLLATPLKFFKSIGDFFTK